MASSTQSIKRWLQRANRQFGFCLLIVLVLFVQSANIARADLPAEIHFGFSDHVKLGHWTPVQIPDDWSEEADAFTLRTIDGDESPVTYSGPLAPCSGENGRRTAYIRFGKKFGSIELQLLAAGKVLSTHIFNKSELAELTFAKSTDLLSVIWGAPGKDDGNLFRSIQTTIALQSPDDQTLTVRRSDVHPPTQPLGWQSVNRLIISVASCDELSATDPATWAAIESWVKSGGDLILFADSQQPELFQTGGPLAKLIPGTCKSAVQIEDSRDLERFVGTSRKRLLGRDDDPLPMLEIEPAADAITVASSGNYPILVRSAHGFGRISFCALDLTTPRLVAWPSYKTLLEKVIADDDRRVAYAGNQDQSRSVDGLTHYGYTDLLGQLRVPLDDFSKVQFLAFTLIAVLITLYILCVAVGDYFFLKKILGKMELTWITFPLIALLFCGLAVGISMLTRPNELQINQMEIVDFDLVDGGSRGTAWVNLYAPAAEKIDVELESKTAFDLAIGQQIVTWQGLPGAGLGGMDNEVSTGFKRLGYHQEISVANDGGMNVGLKQLPLQVASTKPLLIQYEVDAPQNVSSQLSVSRDRLQGTCKNPLGVTVYNAKIFFGDYVYLLKKPLRPDVVTLIESAAKERTLRSHLHRRTAQGVEGNDAGRSQNQPWDPQEKNLTRIADVMMFYQAAGGQGYTGLSNGYHREIDFSKLLRLGRAVLVGQIETGSHIKINGDDASDRYDSNITMIRMVLPVEQQQ